MLACFIFVACLLQDTLASVGTRFKNVSIRCCAWVARVSNYYSRAPPKLSDFTVKTPNCDALRVVWLARVFYWTNNNPTCTDLCNWLEMFGVHATHATLDYNGAKIELDLINKKYTDGRDIEFDNISLDDLSAN